MSTWRNSPTQWWADRLSAPRWRDRVVAAARAARTLEGFRQADLEPLATPDDWLLEQSEQWVDWIALWRFFRGGARLQDEKRRAA